MINKYPDKEHKFQRTRLPLLHCHSAAVTSPFNLSDTELLDRRAHILGGIEVEKLLPKKT